MTVRACRADHSLSAEPAVGQCQEQSQRTHRAKKRFRAQRGAGDNKVLLVLHPRVVAFLKAHHSPVSEMRN